MEPSPRAPLCLCPPPTVCGAMGSCDLEVHVPVPLRAEIDDEDFPEKSDSKRVRFGKIAFLICIQLKAV